MAKAGMTTAKKGQTLVIILFLVLLALSVGITISTRYVQSLRSYVRTDNASRAMAVAEALAERLLEASYATLVDYVDNGTCATACLLDISYPDGQVASATAELSYSTEIEGPYLANLSDGDYYEVELEGYSGSDITLCWNTEASIYVGYVFETGGNIEMDAYAYNATGVTTPNDFSTASSQDGYESCFSINMDNTPLLIRLRAIYEDAFVYVSPEEGTTLPGQGIELAVTGVADDSSKIVRVLKTVPMAPAIFDLMFYQRSYADPLSNAGN